MEANQRAHCSLTCPGSVIHTIHSLRSFIRLLCVPQLMFGLTHSPVQRQKSSPELMSDYSDDECQCQFPFGLSRFIRAHAFVQFFPTVVRTVRPPNLFRPNAVVHSSFIPNGNLPSVRPLHLPRLLWLTPRPLPVTQTNECPKYLKTLRDSMALSNLTRKKKERCAPTLGTSRIGSKSTTPWGSVQPKPLKL